jgi:hypothetical protein
MNEKMILLVVFVRSGLALAGLAIPMMLRLIGPNPWYGFRLPKTMNNREIWYEINAYSGRWFFASGLSAALVAAAVYVLLPGLDADTTALIQAAPIVLLLVIGMRASFNKLSQM